MTDEVHKVVEIKNRAATIHIDESEDPEYPGVSLELVMDDDAGIRPCRFRVDMEWPEGYDTPRLIIWDDPDKEDYSFDIEADMRFLDVAGVEKNVHVATKTGWYSGEDFVAADDGELTTYLQQEAGDDWINSLLVWTVGQGYSLSGDLVKAMNGLGPVVMADLEGPLVDCMAYCHDEPQFRFDGMGFEWHEEGDYLKE